MAKGGLVKDPQLALIGEAGPEIVVPVEKSVGGFSLGLEGLNVLKNFLVSSRGFEQIGTNMRSFAVAEFAQEPSMQSSKASTSSVSGTSTPPIKIIFEGDRLDFAGSMPMMDDISAVDRMYDEVWLPAKLRNMERLGETISGIL